MTISQQLKQQFAFLNNAATNTLSPSEMAELQKAYGVEQSKPRQLSERERAANLEAFNTRLTTEASEMGKAFITNTATLPAEARYRAWQQSQEAVKSRYAHLSEEQQQAALTAFNEHADVFRLADKEAGFFARTGDALSYIPTSLTKLGEQATGLIAPESEARKWFADATQEVESWRSDEAKMRALRASDAMAEAKKRGESGFSQFFANAKDNPLEAVGQFTESALPTIGAAVAGAAAAPFTGGTSLALPFVVGGVQGAGETRNEIYDHIKAMSQSQLEQSPAYQALLTQGLSAEQARESLASSIKEHGWEVLATGVSSAALSQLGGLGRIGQVGKGVMGSTAGKFASEVITEPVDEVFQQVMGNKAINDIDPTHSLTEGLGEAAAGGLLFGAAGGAMAAADNAYRKSKTAPVQPESDLTIDELTQATAAETQPTQSQPQATVNEKVLENVLADYKAQAEEAAYNEMYEEIKADIAEGNIHARAADDNGDTQYRDFARAYLAQTGQTPAPSTQAVETEPDVANKAMQNSAVNPDIERALELRKRMLNWREGGKVGKIDDLIDGDKTFENEDVKRDFALQRAYQEIKQTAEKNGVDPNDNVAMKTWLDDYVANRKNAAVQAKQNREENYHQQYDTFLGRETVPSKQKKSKTNSVPEVQQEQAQTTMQSDENTSIQDDLDPVEYEDLSHLPDFQHNNERVWRGQKNGHPFRSEQEVEQSDVFKKAEEYRLNPTVVDKDGAFLVEIDKTEDIRFSRSPIKSVEANIKRGREAMNTAIAERRTVHRAMFNHNLGGWVDFEWGDVGRLLPSGKTKGAMGISHIIESRMRKDNMDYSQATRMLTDRVVETLAKGKTSQIYESGKVKSVFIDYNGNRATLIKREGSNSWLMNAFELKPTGEQVGSNDPNLPTHTLPTRQRQGMGAVGTDNVQQTALQRNSQTQADQQALSQILGEEIASHIEVVDRNTVQIPKGETIESLKNVEGWYDRSTQKAYIYSEGITEAFGLTREERLAWVAWHELAHKGLNVKYGNTLKSALQQARKHPVVGVISRRIQQNNPSYSDNVAIEEALVELYATYQTDNWASLNQRYQTRINPGYALKGKYDMGNVFQRFAAVIKRLIAALSKNKRAEMMSEQALFDLIKKVDNSVMDLESRKPSTDTQAESDVRYSLNEDPHSEFAKAVDEVVNGNVTRGYINMGTTPDVLKMLGLPDVKIRIQGKTIQKVMGEYLGIEQGSHSHIHNLTPETLKLLPKQINDPVAVFKSSTTDNGYVVLTELSETDNKTGREKPVIAALHLKSGKDGVEIIDVASVYGRSNNQIQTAFENDTLYLNKEKAQNLNTERLQLPWDFTSDNELFSNNVKTEADLSQYQSEISSEIDEQSDGKILFSRRQSVEDLIKTGKAKDDSTTLTQEMIDRDVEGLKSRFHRGMAKLDEAIADSLRPVSDWIDSLDAIPTHIRARIKGRMYRAKTMRNVVRSEFEKRHMRQIIRMLSNLAKEHKKDPLTVKRLVGFYASLRYSIIKNEALLEQDRVAMVAAEQALNEAKANGEPIDALSRAYRRAERQYRYRKHDVELPANSTAEFKVGTAGGWSIAEAKQYMAGIEKHLPKKKMEVVLRRLSEMQKALLELDAKSGRYTPAQIAEYMADEFYVPLTGDPNMDDVDNFIGGTGSRTLNISRDKALKGRRLSEAEDAFDAVWKAVGKTTTFYGWQPFKQDFYDMFQARVETLQAGGLSEKSAKAQAEAELGFSVQKMQGMTRSSDNVLIHKELGQYYEIALPKEMVQMLKDDHVERAAAWTKFISVPTRMMARGVTQLTYDFAPKNMLRDTWDKADMIRDKVIFDKNGKPLSQEVKNKIGRAVWHNMASKEIWKATNKYARGATLDPNSANQAERVMAEFVKYGGLSSFTQNIAQTESDFIKQVKGASSKAKVMVEHLAGYVEAYNGTFDYVSSLATAKALVDNGVEMEQVASLVLDLANFNKTGAKMRDVKGFFMFLQPKMMGAAALLRSLNTRSGKRRFAAQFVTGLVLYQALAMAFSSLFDDEESGNKLDTLGDITGFIPIPLPWADKESDHKYLKLHLGFGSAQLAWNMAVNISRAARNAISYTDAAVNIMTNWGKVFAPVSPSEVSAAKDPVAKAVLTVMPSLFQPIAQLGFNRNAFGSPIHTTFENDGKLKIDQARANTAKEWEALAQWVYDATGGLIDAYPESYKHMVEGYALPLGSIREALNIFIENPNRERLGRTERPVLMRSLVGNTNEFDIQRDFFQAIEESKGTYKAYQHFKENGTLAEWQTPEKMQAVRFYEWADKEERKLKAEKAKRTIALKKGTMSETAYDDWIKNTYTPRTDMFQRRAVYRWRTEQGLDSTKTH